MARRWLFGGALALALAAHAGCANDNQADIVATIDAGSDSGTNGFVTQDAGTADAATEPDEPLLLCKATECPSPYATCPSFGGQLAFKCETNLMNDDANCGACGNQCPTGFGSLGMSTHCVAGQCQRECMPDGDMIYADCNGWVDDGCEVMTSGDRNNCGACGNVCPDGQNCHEGKCGCPAGQVECDGTCVDTNSNDFNCGSCGNHCEDPAEDPPPNMEWGCGGGECGKLHCAQTWNAKWMDCNNNATQPGSDGCEVNVIGNVDNCGGCGVKCAAGQACLTDSKGVPFCGCTGGQTMCGTGTGRYCADLQTAGGDCGACGHGCSGTIRNGQPVCRKGYCSYECEIGWGDCDDDPTNGCETNLMVNGGNCGACGVRCDVENGQPCVEGKCLMTTCDGGVPQ